MPAYLPGLDHLLGEMLTGGFIAVETMQSQQMFRVGPHAPTTEAVPQEDVQRATETLRAIAILSEERAQAGLEEIAHEHYELIP